MDSTVIQCHCGAKLRLPADKRSRAVRCPSCKSPLALTTEASVLGALTIEAEEHITCPICQTQIEAEESCVSCPLCDQTHHQECWSEVGGCGTYGCAEAPTTEDKDTETSAPSSAWGDTKRCPACGETIKSIALRCRYCSTEFDSVDPMSVHDLRHSARTDDQVESLQKYTIAIFVLSLLGCLAPIMAIVALAYLLPRRDKLKKCGPLFVIMGWTAIVLSAIYTVMMVLFFLFGEL